MPPARRFSCPSPDRATRRPASLCASALGSLVTLLAGCEQIVALGTDCPGVEGACLKHKPPILASEAGPDFQLEPDSGAGGTGSSSGGGGEDAGRDAPATDAGPHSSAAWIGVKNPSFNLTAGTTGPLYDVLGTNRVAPWEACQPVGAGTVVYNTTTGLRAESEVDLKAGDQGPGTPAVQVRPTDSGNTGYFIAASFLLSSPFPIPLVQQLSAPLRKGQRYAFVVDLRSASHGKNVLLLEVWGGGQNTCELRTKLTSTPPIADGDWKSVCVAFTPDQDYPQIVLKAAVDVDLASNPLSLLTYDSQLFFDNLRQEPNCN